MTVMNRTGETVGPLAEDVAVRADVVLTTREQRICAKHPMLEGAIRHWRAELARVRSETDPRYAKARRRYVREIRVALRGLYARSEEAS